MSKKKLIIIIVSAIAIIAICGIIGFAVLNNNSNNNTKAENKSEIKLDNKETVSIIPSANKTVEYETFNNGLLKMEIPKGWKLEVPNTVTYSGYTFKVYNPDDKDYLFEFSLGLTGFLKSEAARAKYASLYPAAVFGQLPAIDPQTTEQFYKVWNTTAKVGNEVINQEFFVYLNEFEMIENLGKTNLGGDVIRGKFLNENNEQMQGLFTTSIYDSGSYYMYGLDLAPLNSYHNIIMYAPDDEFNNWQSIFDYCLSTMEFSEEFMRGFNREQTTIVSTVQANAKIYDEISDMIMDSWEKRNNSYDIINQKRSDATLGYERVYDTDTGDVYRAYNGFTDSYSGSKYQSITDDMYTTAISGYIEK